MPFPDDSLDRSLVPWLPEALAGREERALHTFGLKGVQDGNHTVKILKMSFVIRTVMRREDKIDLLFVDIDSADHTVLILPYPLKCGSLHLIGRERECQRRRAVHSRLVR